MNSVTKKWIFHERLVQLILIPLMIWFILNLVSIFDKDYIDIVNFFTTQPSKVLFSINACICLLFFCFKY